MATYILSGYVYKNDDPFIGMSTASLVVAAGSSPIAYNKSITSDIGVWTTTNSSEWQYLEKTTTIPLGVTSVVIHCNIRGQLNYSATVYFDDISFIKESIPPSAITNLSALTGSNGGEIILTWSSPGNNGNNGVLLLGSEYAIKYTSDIAQIDTVFSSTQNPNVLISTSNVNPGETQEYTIGGLVEGATYYFRIWTKDNSGNWSEISNGATAWAMYQVDFEPPDAISDLVALPITEDEQITLKWTSPGDDGSSGFLTGAYLIQYASQTTIDEVEWSTSNVQVIISTTNVTPGSTQYYTINLRGGTTYYFRIWTRDEVYNYSTVSNGATIYLGIYPPEAITDLTATLWNSTVGAVMLQWTAPADPPSGGKVSGYIIRYATFTATSVGGIENWWDLATDVYGEPIPASAGNLQIMTISGLPSGQFVTFHIRSIDAVNNLSDIDTSEEQTVDVPPHLLISEVQFQTGNFDYIELYNPTDNPINLVDLGLKIHRRSSGESDYLFNIEFLNTTIPAKGYFLIVSTPTYQPNGKQPDARLPHNTSGTNNNISADNSVYISLSATALVDVIDVVAFGSGTDSFIDFGDPNAPKRYSYSGNATQSVERKPGGGANSTLGNEFDSNKFDYDFDLIDIDPQNSSDPTEPPPTVPNAPSISYNTIDISTGHIKWILTDNATDEEELYVSSATDISARLSPNLGPLSGTGGSTSWIEVGLSSNTLYTRYAEAYKTTGSSWSAGLTVCTLAYPPQTVNVTPVNANTIDISWNYSGATKYLIARSTSNFDAQWSTSAVILSLATTHQDTGLSANTTYYYRIYVYNQQDKINQNFYSPTVSTLTYPSQPTGFSAINRTATSITWAWEEPQGGCDGYRIYRATDNSEIAYLLPSETSYVETGLSTNTAYGRYVRAYNIVGESLDSNHATVYTLAVTAENLQIVEVYSSSVTLVWESGGNPSWTRYGVAVSTDNFETDISTKIAFNENYTQLTATITNLDPDTTYYFRVWAYNGDGIESGYSNIASTVTLLGPPAAPVGFEGAAISTVSIKWEWNITRNATYYQIYDAYTEELLANLEGNETTTWIEINLSSNTQYSRYVKAGNEYGLSERSNIVSKYTLAYPPTILTATPISSSTITLSWNYSGATKYEVWYSTDLVNYYKTDTVNSPTVNYSHQGLVAGITYYYKIVSVNTDNEPNYNFDFPTVSTRALPSQITSFSGIAQNTTSILWIWSSALGADRYRIYTATDNSIVAELPASETSYLETNLSTNTAYGRYVRAVNTSGLGELSPKTTVYTLAATPIDILFIGVYYTSVTFNWSSNGNPQYTIYEVSQSTDNFQTNFSTPIISTSETTVTITNLLAATTYYFRVRAFNYDNIPTNFSVIVSTVTLPLPPIDICITEVLANDSHSTEGPGEFVEVYNCGLVEVNLAGMFLYGEGETNDNIIDYTGAYDLGQPGTILYPGWYALIVDPDYDGWYNNCIQQHADLNKLIMLTIGQDTTLGSGGLANTFESVWIVSGTVVLTSFTWVSDAGNGKSWEKIDYSGPAIDKSDSGNWAISTHQSDNNSYCTPGFLNSVSAGIPPPPSSEDVNPSDVVINEFLYDAVLTDNGNEWIELYNNLSTKTVNLAGWKIQKSTGPTLDVAVWTDLFTITSGNILPNGYFLCAQSTAAAKYLADFTYSDSATMNNSAPFAIRLVTPSGKEIDRVAYGGSGSDYLAEGSKAAVGVSAGESLSRSPDGKDTDNNYNDFVVLSKPTPTNSSGPDKTPPAAITDLKAQTGQNPGEIILTWTAPGDDGSIGNNTQEAYYVVKFATYPITQETIDLWWQQAIEYVQQWKVAAQGTTEQKVLQGFIPSTTYYFAIKTVDDAGNISDIDINTQNLTQAFAYAQAGFIGSLIRINEVAPDQTSTAGYDWIEFYNASTQAINIFGWKIYEIYTSSIQPIETIEADWSFPANTYLVLRFAQQRNMSAPKQISPNYYELYTDKPGLVATDNIIVLTDKDNNWIDVLCYADRSGSLSNATRFRAAYNYAVSINQWYGPYADGTNDEIIEYYCASTLFMSSNRSLARDEYSTDGTNPSVNEWYLTLTLTRGSSNSGIDRTPPAAVTTLQATAGANRGQVKLSWISVGNDGYTGTAAGYMLRYNVFPITEENFFNSINADRISKDSQSDTVYMKPQAPMKIETTVGALPVGQTYYFAIKVLDERVNFSVISNVVSFVPPDIVGSNIRINEFAVLESTQTGGDWVELYNTSEDTVNIKGWILWGIKAGDTTPSKIKEFPDINLSPKDYLVVNCISGIDETISKGENGYWDVFTDYDIKGFDGVLFLTDLKGFSGDYGNIVDFVAYTSGGAPLWKNIWNTACNYNQWSPYINTDAEGINYAVDWSSGQPGFSLGRNGFSTDTDNTQYAKNDFKLYRVPTKGFQNDDIPPAKITYIVATTTEIEGSIKLNWVVPGDDEFVGINYGKYEIKYATFTVDISSTVWWQQISNRNIYSGVVELKIGVDISTAQPYEYISCTITGLFPGLTYYFSIRTYDDVGNVSEFDLYLANNNPVFAVAFDTIPAKVQNFKLAAKNKAVELSWDKNTEADLSHYEIYCSSLGIDADQFFVYSTTEVVFSHTGLKNGQIYYYKLYAVDLKQNKSLPTTGYAIPKMLPPTKLFCKHYGTYIELKWLDSEDRNADNFLMYKIYRSSSQNGPFISISSTTENYYIDGYDIKKTGYYYYYVVSIDSDYIESEPSNVAEAIPDLLPPKFEVVSVLTSRDLGKQIAKVDLKVVDDRFENGDRQGKLVSLEGKYRVVGTTKEYFVKFVPEFVSGIAEYIGSAEFDFSVITIGDKGIEYQFIAKDEVNTTYYPSDGSWEKVEPTKDIPEQKFITVSNPEVVFGKEAEEVVIYDQQGNVVWQQKAEEGKLIVWKGNDKNDKFVESGAYIYQIKTKDGKRKYGVVIVVK